MAVTWEVSPTRDWPGVYGSRGVWIAGIPDAGYLAVTPRIPLALSGGVSLVFNNNSSSPISMVKPDGSGRIESVYYNGSNTPGERKIHFRLDIPDGPAMVRFYCYDRYGGSTKQKATVTTLSGQVIDEGFTLMDFAGGVYAGLPVDGPCIVTWEGTAGYLVQASGLFIDPPIGPPPDNVSPVISVGRVNETGDRITLTFSEPIQGASGFEFHGQYGDGSVLYQPASPFTVEVIESTPTELVFRVARTRPIFRGELVSYSYLASGDVRDAAGNALAPFAGFSIDNGSQAQGPAWQVIARAVLVQSDMAAVRTCQTIERLEWPG